VPVSIRVGQGFDVHPFSDDPTARWCSAGSCSRENGSCHSDADAIAHASPTPSSALPAWATRPALPTLPGAEGADSLDLSTGGADVRAAGWELAMTALSCRGAEAAPRDEQDVLEWSEPGHGERKRAERLGALGRREGNACLAVAIVSREG
jgi:2-C-methyl-D-erythritol 2,4-cyclodiphosphate synthase